MLNVITKLQLSTSLSQTPLNRLVLTLSAIKFHVHDLVLSFVLCRV